MPELPEVEGVKNTLLPLIQGKIIREISINYEPIIKYPTPLEFKYHLLNKPILDVKRRGKYLFFEIQEVTLISHLRMEGKYIYLAPNQILSEKEQKHAHIFFTLDDQSQLIYHDVRKFGTMDVVHREAVDDYPSIKKLGVEPTASELTVDYLYPLLKQKQQKLKLFLLNQEYIAGIGNIYADEILYAAKLHPERLTNTLTIQEVDQLVYHTIQIIDHAVHYGGTTVRTYKNALGNHGTYQDQLAVYGKEGSPCLRCETSIQKTKVGNRGTHFCPNCQNTINLLN